MFLQILLFWLVGFEPSKSPPECQAVHRETAESTNARVMWWTFAEVVLGHFEQKQKIARNETGNKA